MKSQYTLSKALKKSKDITARFLINLIDTSIASQMVERACNIVLFLIEVDWFLPIIASKVFCIRFLRIVVKIL